MNMIVAMTHKLLGIGNSCEMPMWGIPEVVERFDKMTTGKMVVMGRKTFENLGGRPLRCRHNVVVSRTLDPILKKDHATTTTMVVIDNADKILLDDESFVIGGASMFRKFLGVSKRIYATLIEREFEADLFFPTTKFGMYRLEHVGQREWSDLSHCFYRFVTYKLVGRMSDEASYLDLAREIVSTNSTRPDRTGMGTFSIFGRQLKFDISESIPLMTTRCLGIKTILRELLWMLRGSSDSKELERDGVRIWAGNTSRAFLDARGLTSYAEGETGPLYGWSLRHFGAEYDSSKKNSTCGFDSGFDCGFDQLDALVKGLREDPYSRRHIMTTFDPSVVDRCVLAPCHGIAIQFYVSDSSALHATNRRLSCHVYCRSSDTFLGLPFNIASYAILVYVVAKKCDMVPAELVVSLGDAHVYSNHRAQVDEQTLRNPLPFPKLIVDDSVADKDWSEIDVDDFQVVGYISHPLIRAEMAI